MESVRGRFAGSRRCSRGKERHEQGRIPLRRVRKHLRAGPGHEADYERWLDAIRPVVEAWPGHLDWHLIRPCAAQEISFRFRTP